MEVDVVAQDEDYFTRRTDIAVNLKTRRIAG